MLFGHQTDDTGQTPTTGTATPDPGMNPLAVDPATGASLPVAPSDSGSVLHQSSAVSPANDYIPPPPPPAPSDASSSDIASDASVEPTMPFMSDSASTDSTHAPTPLNLPEVSTGDTPAGSTSTADASDTPASDSTDTTAGTSAGGNLLDLKQQALTQLSPLISQLDQTPEEKFRTIMMLIQSSDNQTLIPNAYEAAQAIPDEKVRAQALLDVINEINYFTQKDAS